MPTSSKPFALTPLALVLLTLLFSAVLVPIVAVQYSYMPLFGAAAAAGGVLLLVTAAGVWWVGRRAARDLALRVGLALGLLWVVEIGINNFLAPPLPARDIIDNSFWAIVAAGILALAVYTTYRTGRFGRGLLSGAWSGLVSGTLACAMALSVIVFAMRFLVADPLNVAEWTAIGPTTGAPSIAAYFAFETLAGGFLHLTVLGLVMGTLLGLLGGLLGKGLRLLKPSGRPA